MEPGFRSTMPESPGKLIYRAYDAILCGDDLAVMELEAVMGSFRFSSLSGKAYDPFVSFTMRYLAIDCASIEPLDVFLTLDFFIPLTSRPFRI